MRMSLAYLAPLTALLLGACTTSPDNVAGDYTMTLTEHDNGCNLANWTVGRSTTGVPVTITQSDTQIAAQVGGAGAAVLDVWLGSSQYNGNVDGAHITLAVTGTTPHSSGNCAYTYNSSIDGDLSGDALSGTLSFTAQTNNGSDCGTLTGCVSTEAFNGTRPPQ